MQAALFNMSYVLAIGLAGAVLFLAVHWFETNRWYAFALKFLIIGLGAAALARRLLP
jgi:hypothetical protein